MVEIDLPDDYPFRAPWIMQRLFAGRTDVYGLNKGAVRHGSVDMLRYEKHLQGKESLGIFPVRDGDTVVFAAIDLDEPDFELATELAELLPGRAWIEKSRSGNAHVWTFFADSLEAWAAKAVLRSATLAVGRPDVEVFPKQAGLKPGMVGNYINLPLFGDTRPILTSPPETDAFKVPLAFLEDAYEQRTDPEEWRDRARSMGAGPEGKVKSDGAVFRERSKPHMCALHMLQHKDDNPLAEGHRAVVLFNLAKMLANVSTFEPEEVFDLVEEYNQAGESPVPESEVRRFVGNAFRGEFTSTGCDDALMAPYIHPDCPIAASVNG
jgi:hypothetical protein